MITLARTETGAARELERHRAAAIDHINAAIGQARAKLATNIPFQDMMYLEKKAEATSYVQQNPEPETLDDYPLIAAEIGITGETPAQIVQVWLNTKAQWTIAAAALESLRLGTIDAVNEAESRDAIAAVEAAFDAQANTVSTSNSAWSEGNS